MGKVRAQLRRASIVATLALAAGGAGTAHAEFNSALTAAQIDRIFAQDCQSEEAGMRRAATAEGAPYNRNEQLQMGAFTANDSRASLEQNLSEIRGAIEGTTNPLNRALYLLGHCVLEAKYNLALEREKLTAPGSKPTPTPTPSSTYQAPQPVAPTTPASTPTNGPLAGRDEEEEEDQPAATPPPSPAQANLTTKNYGGNGPLTTSTTPTKQVDNRGEPIDSNGRCFRPPPPDEEQLPSGMKYTFVFVNRCDDPIVVDLTYSANPQAADPSANVTLYHARPLTWSCTDLKIGGSDCTQGVVGMSARWR